MNEMMKFKVRRCASVLGYSLPSRAIGDPQGTDSL